MKRPIAALVTCAATAACRAPASELPRPEALRFGVSHFEGSYRFVVYEDGRAHYEESRGHAATPDRVIDTEIDPVELRALARVLRENDFCGLRASERKRVPDEARPSIAIRYEDLDCRVTMLDGQFRDNPRAQRSLAAVEALGKRLREAK